MTESLTKALHDADFLRADLLAALNQSTAVEALILMSMIERAALLRADLDALMSARGAV